MKKKNLKKKLKKETKPEKLRRLEDEKMQAGRQAMRSQWMEN